MKHVLGNKKAIALFVVPGLILYVGLVFVPVIWSFVYSLYSGTPGLSWSFSGLKNYSKLLIDSKFHESLMVTIRYILTTMLGMVVLGLALAMMYRFWLVKFKNLIRTITFFPVILPTVAVGQLFRKIYEIQPNYGLLNSILDAIGLHDLVQPWIGQASTALGCLSVMDIWVSVGFYAVIFYGGLIDIPDDIIEAAKVDGATKFQLIRYIDLPSILPTATILLIMNCGSILSIGFEKAYLLQNSLNGSVSEIISTYVYKVGLVNNDMSYSTAIGLFQQAVNCVLLFGSNFVVKKMSGEGFF